MFIEYVLCDIHPVGDHRLGYVLGQKVRNGPATDRVGADARGALAPEAVSRGVAVVRVPLVGTSITVVARASHAVDLLSHRRNRQ